MYDDDFLPPEPLPTPPSEQVPAPKSDEGGPAALELPSGGGSEPSDSPAAPPDQPDQPDTSDSAPSYRRRRTSEVARLPKETRDKINQMLLDGLPYRKLIENLGDTGQHLNEDIMGRWKRGGYQDWLLELDRKEALGFTRDAALDLVKEKAGVTVQDAGRTVAAAQLYELLLSFDPSTFAAALVDKPELYLRLINSLSRLSEGETACARIRPKESALAPAQTSGEPGGAPKVVNAETLKEIARLIKLL